MDAKRQPSHFGKRVRMIRHTYAVVCIPFGVVEQILFHSTLQQVATSTNGLANRTEHTGQKTWVVHPCSKYGT